MQKGLVHTSWRGPGDIDVFFLDLSNRYAEGQYALHPSQSDKSCGKKGLNGFYVRNVDEKFGANCYGLAPNKK